MVCCCLPLLPQLACNFLAIKYKEIFSALYAQGSDEVSTPGCVNAEGKLSHKWQARAVTIFTKPGVSTWADQRSLSNGSLNGSQVVEWYFFLKSYLRRLNNSMKAFSGMYWAEVLIKRCLLLLRIPYQKTRFPRTANQMHAKWIWLAVLKDSLRTANQIDRGFLMQPMRLLVLMNSLRVTKTSTYSLPGGTADSLEATSVLSLVSSWFSCESTVAYWDHFR